MFVPTFHNNSKHYFPRYIRGTISSNAEWINNSIHIYITYINIYEDKNPRTVLKTNVMYLQCLVPSINTIDILFNLYIQIYSHNVELPQWCQYITSLAPFRMHKHKSRKRLPTAYSMVLCNSDLRLNDFENTWSNFFF